MTNIINVEIFEDEENKYVLYDDFIKLLERSKELKEQIKNQEEELRKQSEVIIPKNIEQHNEIVDLNVRIKEIEEENKKLNTIIEEMKKFLKNGTELTCGSGITIEYIYAYENALDTLEDLIKGEKNDEVEIIEDSPKDNKIEKLIIYENMIDWCCNGRAINDTEKDIIDKLNEIIDKVNKNE